MINSIKTVKKVGDTFVVNDAMTIPNDKENGHYQLLMKWVKDGNKIEEPTNHSSITGEESIEFDGKEFSIDKNSVDMLSKIILLKELKKGFYWLDVKGNKVYMNIKEANALYTKIIENHIEKFNEQQRMR